MSENSRYLEVFKYFTGSKEGKMNKKDIEDSIIALGGDPELIKDKNIPSTFSFEEFSNLMNELNINPNDLHNKLTDILNMLDENSNGTIEVSLMKQILREEGLEESKIKKILKLAPKKNDNEIIIKDFVNDLLIEI